MNSKQKITKILQIILPILMCIFIWHNFKISGNNILFLPIFLGLYFAVKYTMQELNKKKTINIATISVCYTIATLIGKSVAQDYTLNNIFDKWFVINLLRIFCDRIYAYKCLI